MKRWRYLVALAVAVGLYAAAGPALDRCSSEAVPVAWVDPTITGVGPLQVGAARVQLQPRFPVTLGGYGPPRGEAERALVPLYARAVVLRRGSVRIGVVNADALLIPEGIDREVRRRAKALGLTDALVVATHAHSSFGGYDAKWAAQVAALGRFRQDVRDALTDALVEALKEASAKLLPARIALAQVDRPDLLRSRDPGEPVDPRLTRVVFEGEAGPLAQWILFSAHPTTAGRRPAGLDPDYPGRLAADEEQKGHGVTLFLPGAVGNASANVGGGPEAFAHAVEAALPPEPAPVATAAAQDDELRLEHAHATLPHPDASRLVPFGLRHLTADVLCESAPRQLDLSVLELGPLRLVAVPGEATWPAAKLLEEAAGTDARVVSLADGYLGYVEPADAVRAREGESKRQYFGPELLERMVRALAGR